MSSSLRKMAAAAIGLLLFGALQAQELSAIEQRLEGLVPDLESVVIAETPIEDLMQVQIGSDVVYMSRDGRFLMQGRLVDMDTQVDLTDQAKSVVRRERLANLDRSEFVTFGNQDSEFDVIVFTDVDCGYCRRLHEQINDYVDAGIRINYMAFPRAGVGSHSYDKMVSVWCADDRNAAMDLAKTGREPNPASCKNPVAEQYQLGQSIGVTGTPSIMTFDGMVIPGYVPPEQLLGRLRSLTPLAGGQ